MGLLIRGKLVNVLKCKKCDIRMINVSTAQNFRDKVNRDGKVMAKTAALILGAFIFLILITQLY
jgi:hypothetical protein